MIIYIQLSKRNLKKLSNSMRPYEKHTFSNIVSSFIYLPALNHKSNEDCGFSSSYQNTTETLQVTVLRR